MAKYKKAGVSFFNKQNIVTVGKLLGCRRNKALEDMHSQESNQCQDGNSNYAQVFYSQLQILVFITD